jgi:hypothetical protein
VGGRKSSRGDIAAHEKPTSAVREHPAAEIMSFLREIGTSITWTEKDAAKSLKIDSVQGKEVLSVLQLALIGQKVLCHC